MSNLSNQGIQIDFNDLEQIKKDIINVKRRKDFNEEIIKKEEVMIHMDYAYSLAKKRCYAKRRKVAAIIYKDGRPLSSGYNGTKSGYPNVCEKNGVSISGVIHAEKNALAKLSRPGTDSPLNSAVFVTTAPCNLCAEDLILWGISSVYFTELYRGIDGVEELIKNGVSVYHVDLKKINDYDRIVEDNGTFNYQDYPQDFLTIIYKSDDNNSIDNKINGILNVRDLFSNYVDGKYHNKFYDVSI